MFTEKLDIESLTDYVMKKHKPQRIVIAPESVTVTTDNEEATHIIYEIGGDSTTKILTRVGDAKPGKSPGDYTINIYPQFSVSGELVLIRMEKRPPPCY